MAVARFEHVREEPRLRRSVRRLFAQGQAAEEALKGFCAKPNARESAVKGDCAPGKSGLYAAQQTAADVKSVGGSLRLLKAFGIGVE